MTHETLTHLCATWRNFLGVQEFKQLALKSLTFLIKFLRWHLISGMPDTKHTEHAELLMFAENYSAKPSS
jgi:hypothetical protein